MQERINALAKAGYRLHSISHIANTYGFVIVMELENPHAEPAIPSAETGLST